MLVGGHLSTLPAYILCICTYSIHRYVVDMQCSVVGVTVCIYVLMYVYAN